jgi:gas vesicle protein
MIQYMKYFLVGMVVGAIIAFPLGINFGRDEPLLSNPFKNTEVKEQVKKRASETGKEIVEEARETLHKATEPVKKELNK